MTENRLNHKLDTSKIKTLKDVRNVFQCMNLYASAEEGNEQYELLKEYFTIPNPPQEFKFEYPRKSLEEIQQEFDKKIDKQIEDVEYKFAQLKYYQEYQFSKKITKIIEDIEYAKKYGSFPLKLTVGKLDYSTLGVSSTISTNASFVVRGNTGVGYYGLDGGNYRFYMDKKPNVVFRWFVKRLMGFEWRDEK
jgi:hypothetical protein